MEDAPPPASFRPLVELATEMRDKEYRDQYVESFSRQLLARQMRGFRGEKTQADYGKEIDKNQTQVARFEDPTYGWQTRTVFEIARRQNVAALICFVDFETFLRFEKVVSEDILTPKPYDQVSVGDFATESDGQRRTQGAVGEIVTHDFGRQADFSPANDDRVIVYREFKGPIAANNPS